MALKLEPFIKDSGEIHNLENITIKTGEQKRFPVENIYSGELVPYYIDFYIIYKYSPANAIYRLLSLLGLKETIGVTYFRLEDGKLYDIAKPDDRATFEKRTLESFRRKVHGKGGFLTWNPIVGKPEF